MRYDKKELEQWNTIWGLLRTDFLGKLINVKEGRLLDIAGYKGDLKRMLSKDVEYHLIDQYALEGENFLKVDLDTIKDKKLPYEDNYFDAVVAADIFEHLKYPMVLLDEIRRILKKDGVLITSRHLVPTEAHYYYVSTRFFDGWREVWSLPTMQLLSYKTGYISNNNIKNFKDVEGVIVPSTHSVVHEIFYCLRQAGE